MKYIILGKDNKEYGPVEAETLKKWVESGRVLPDTPVRNSLIKKWEKARDMDFLAPAFAIQMEKMEEQKGVQEKTFEIISSFFSGKSKKKAVEESSAFRNKYLPDPPSIALRLFCVCFDGVVVLGLFILAFLIGASMYKAGGNPNSIFLALFPLFVCSVLLYYGLALGLYAQTIGMWFWGVIIVKPDLGEVFLGRAYLYSVLMLLFGITSPLIVYFNPSKRSLPEILSGTMLIRTAARAKS